MATKRSEYGGSVYDQQYFTDDELKQAAAIRAAAQNGQTTWQDANRAVEAIRANYGYSGGSNGAGYTQLQSAAKSTAPTYTSKYADAIDYLYNSIANREAFSYDYNTDPSYKAYAKQYAREGQRATADTLGQAAALTGGMASTAAVNAASQAGDYYASQLSDKIPELYNAAYSMYVDEGNTMRNNLSNLLAMENADYSKYQDQLNQYNTDRNYNYNVSQDSLSNATSKVSSILQTGDASSLTDAELSAAGYTRSQANTIAAFYKAQNTKSSGTGSAAKVETPVDSYSLYDKVVSATGQKNIFTPEQFNRQSFMGRKYGTYENYCKSILSQYGISYDQLDNKINNTAAKNPKTATYNQDTVKYAKTLLGSGDDRNSNGALEYLWNNSETEDLFVSYAKSIGLTEKEINQFLNE